MKIHYANMREAKRGDYLICIPSYSGIDKPIIGILYNLHENGTKTYAVIKNDYTWERFNVNLEWCVRMDDFMRFMRDPNVLKSIPQLVTHDAKDVL